MQKLKLTIENQKIWAIEIPAVLVPDSFKELSQGGLTNDSTDPGDAENIVLVPNDKGSLDLFFKSQSEDSDPNPITYIPNPVAQAFLQSMLDGFSITTRFHLHNGLHIQINL